MDMKTSRVTIPFKNHIDNHPKKAEEAPKVHPLISEVHKDTLTKKKMSVPVNNINAKAISKTNSGHVKSLNSSFEKSVVERKSQKLAPKYVI